MVPANPRLRLQATSLIGVDISNVKDEDTGDLLAGTFIGVMKETGMPNGLKAIGFEVQDIEDLVAGTLPKHRVTKLSPLPARAEDLVRLFQESMTIW
jgi:hydroxyacid-oxoacid transhydrogenase